MWEWFYNIPTILALILFVVVVTVISLMGLYIFKSFNIQGIVCQEHNTIVGIFIAVVSVFFGVMLTFIIIEVWNDYDRARLDATKEAGSLFLLFQTMRALPNTRAIQELIVEYVQYIINDEYPSFRSLTVSEDGGKLLIRMQEAIYNYQPEGDQQVALYTSSLDLMNSVITYRIDRFDSAVVGVNRVVWWLTIINSVLLIVMSWFISCSAGFHYILTSTVAIHVASSVFLIIILTYPFIGYSAIPPTPFVLTLKDMLALMS